MPLWQRFTLLYFNKFENLPTFKDTMTQIKKTKIVLHLSDLIKWIQWRLFNSFLFISYFSFNPYEVLITFFASVRSLFKQRLFDLRFGKCKIRVRFSNRILIITSV
jgi:hypothetical protein